MTEKNVFGISDELFNRLSDIAGSVYGRAIRNIEAHQISQDKTAKVFTETFDGSSLPKAFYYGTLNVAGTDGANDFELTLRSRFRQMTNECEFALFISSGTNYQAFTMHDLSFDVMTLANADSHTTFSVQFTGYKIVFA